MKPCFGKRKELALLAIGGGSLDDGRENALRAHLESCDGCRGYLAEISGVAGKLSAVESASEIRASDDFHRKTLAAIEMSAMDKAPSFGVELLRLVNWRLALPAVAILTIILLVLSPNKQQPRPLASVIPPPLPHSAPPSNSPRRADLAPTFGSYELVASESLEKLDDLITLQATRSAPSAPAIAATLFPRSDLSD
jgi:hypothetical protein